MNICSMGGIGPLLKEGLDRGIIPPFFIGPFFYICSMGFEPKEGLLIYLALGQEYAYVVRVCGPV